MVYNPPPTGHVVLVLDNGTTAMTGQQEHPGTGRTLNHEPTGRLSIEGVARAMGVAQVDVVDPVEDPQAFEALLRRRLAETALSLIVARRPCLLAAPDIRRWEKAAAAKRGALASCEGCLPDPRSTGGKPAGGLEHSLSPRGGEGQGEGAAQ